MNHQDLAARLRADAKLFELENSNPEDAEIQNLVNQDMARMSVIAGLVEQGDLKQAFQLAEKLDIAVKDVISEPFWRALRETERG